MLALAVPSVARAGGDDRHELPAVMALRHDGVARGVTVYLDPDGGTVTGGWDDAATGVSSIALGVAGERVTVPAWRGGARRWQQVVQCVRDRFAAFAIDVVTDRPAGDDYTLVLVGGRPSLFGYPSSVSGVAPYSGEVMRGAIAFVFSDVVESEVEQTCTGILHEVGHTLGLDHEYLCEDPMSYLWGCGEKRFQDQVAACGEEEERSCGNGEATQNSYRTLVAAVGLRAGDAAPVTRAPTPAPP
ncbi:MAG: hypothetical protein KC464_33680, partial [Myxococcales bacterium]|nr:hypothetical protein [Myxococcales bacterium]